MIFDQRGTKKKRPGPTRMVSGVLLLAVLLLVSGCYTVKGPLFPPRQPELVWPPSPEPARIRWVGAISTTGDLNVHTESFLGLADLLTGPEDEEGMSGPRAALVTPDGRWLYAADPGMHCLHVWDLVEREYRRILRIGDTNLAAPVGLCLGPSASLFIFDSAAPAVLVLPWMGEGEAGALKVPGSLVRPVAGVWEDARQELFVVDSAAHDIKVLDARGQSKRVLGGRGLEPGNFNFPTSIALHGDRLWIADSGNQRVQALTLQGAPLLAFGSVGDAPGKLALPKGVALDSEGHVYVVDARFENIQIFDQEGRVLLVFGREGSEAGEFWLPAGIFIDGNDRLWVSDQFNKRVQVFDYLSMLPDEDSRQKPVEKVEEK